MRNEIDLGKVDPARVPQVPQMPAATPAIQRVDVARSGGSAGAATANGGRSRASCGRPAGRGGREQVSGRAWRALAVASLGTVLVGFNSTATNIALPSILEGFPGATAPEVAWAVGWLLDRPCCVLAARRSPCRSGRAQADVPVRPCAVRLVCCALGHRADRVDVQRRPRAAGHRWCRDPAVVAQLGAADVPSIAADVGGWHVVCCWAACRGRCAAGVVALALGGGLASAVLRQRARRGADVRARHAGPAGTADASRAAAPRRCGRRGCHHRAGGDRRCGHAGTIVGLHLANHRLGCRAGSSGPGVLCRELAAASRTSAQSAPASAPRSVG